MAQLIRCDYQGCAEIADVLVSRIINGETVAWCDPHYLEMCQAIVGAVAQAEADQAAADAEARLAAAHPPTNPPTSGGSSDADDPPAGRPTKPADGRKAARGPRTPPRTAPAALGPSDAPTEDLAGVETRA